MTDPFDPLRRLRPDDVVPDDAADPAVYSRHKEQMMSMIEQRSPEATGELRIPRIYPRLAYRDQLAAIEYLMRVFGLQERREARQGTPEEGIRAWLEHGDGVIMISSPNHDVHRLYSPAEVGQSTTLINVAVHDVDTHYQRAVAEGAMVTMPLADAFYGHRRYEASDPEGHRWHFYEPLADIRARGGTVADDNGE